MSEDFYQWWSTSKYTQVVYPDAKRETIAKDAWDAAMRSRQSQPDSSAKDSPLNNDPVAQYLLSRPNAQYWSLSMGIIGMLEELGWVPLPWQPISTAPKDGTKILVWVDGAYMVYFDEDMERWTTDGKTIFVRFFPTHWMPIPARPKE